MTLACDMSQLPAIGIKAATNRLLCITLLFILGIILFTRNNTFPFEYHPDEESKITQVLTQEHNFRHPLLLLDVTTIGHFLANSPSSTQTVALIGRWISALFAVGCVVIMALMGWRLAGPATGWLAGTLTLVSSQLFELAHYFKEDTAFAFGCCLFWFAITFLSKNPHIFTTIGLGVTASLAMSAKYIGLLCLVIALALIIFQTRGAGIRVIFTHLALCLATAIGIFITVNLPAFFDFDQLKISLNYEFSQVTLGEAGIARSIPHMFYLKALPDQVGWPVLGFAAISILTGLMRPPSRKWPLSILTFLIIYLVLLSCSPKVAHRYLLPITLGLIFFAALVPATLLSWITHLIRFTPRWTSSTIVIVLSALLVASSAIQLKGSVQNFREDSRAELIRHLISTFPVGSRIVYETRVGLTAPIPGREALNGYELIRKDIAPDVGSIDQLRNAGITAVAIYGTTRSYYRSSQYSPQAKVRADYERRRTFYQQLDEECYLIWRSKKRPGYLSPDLRLYSLIKRRKD